MTLFLLLIAVVVIVCIFATRLSSKFGVPTLLIFIFVWGWYLEVMACLKSALMILL